MIRLLFSGKFASSSSNLLSPVGNRAERVFNNRLSLVEAIGVWGTSVTSSFSGTVSHGTGNSVGELSSTILLLQLIILLLSSSVSCLFEKGTCRGQAYPEDDTRRLSSPLE